SQSNGNGAGFLRTTREALVRTFSASEPNTYKGTWRHPAKGTGQICEYLERGIRENGGVIHNQAKLVDMAAEGARVTSVPAQINGETTVFEAPNVLSSIPLEFLIQILLKKKFDAEFTQSKASPFRRKTVVLIYLFLDEPPRFPHAWLNV